MRALCYTAAVPLLIYGVLLGLGLIARDDASVAVLVLAESVAVVVTVRATLERYRSWWRR